MILAFLVSPVAYILVYMTTVTFFLEFTDLTDMYVVLYSMPTYFLYVLFSIPVFFLVRRFYGWNFLSCSVLALLVVMIPEVWRSAWTVQAPVAPYQLWLLAAIAVLAYGAVFWLLVPTDFRK